MRETRYGVIREGGGGGGTNMCFHGNGERDYQRARTWICVLDRRRLITVSRN